MILVAAIVSFTVLVLGLTAMHYRFTQNARREIDAEDREVLRLELSRPVIVEPPTHETRQALMDHEVTLAQLLGSLRQYPSLNAKSLDETEKKLEQVTARRKLEAP